MKKNIYGSMALASLVASLAASVVRADGGMFDNSVSTGSKDVAETLSSIKTQAATLGQGKLDLPPDNGPRPVKLVLPPLEPAQAGDIPHPEKRNMGGVSLKNGWSVGGEIGGGFISRGGTGGSGPYGGVYAQKDIGNFFFLKGVLGYGRFTGHSESDMGSTPIGQQWIAGQDPAWPEGSLYNVNDRVMQYRDLTVEIGPSLEAGIQTPRTESGLRLKLSAVLAMAKVRENETIKHFNDYFPTDTSGRDYLDHVDASCTWVPDLVSVNYCYDVYNYVQSCDDSGNCWYDSQYDHTQCDSVTQDRGYYQCTDAHDEVRTHYLSPFSQEMNSMTHTVLDTGWSLAPGLALGVEMGDNDMGLGINYRLLFLPQSQGVAHLFTVDGHMRLTDD